MLGLEKDSVKLAPHDERWHQLFDEEKARIENAVGKHIIAVEHLGSTSVCGISAKPILDIGVAIENFSDGERLVAPLENLGYIFRGENGIPGRHYFVKGAPRRTHHLHIVELKSDLWKNHLLFRDYLRENPAAAKEYENLKKSLAEKHAENRGQYTTGKSAFIEKVLQTAGIFNN